MTLVSDHVTKCKGCEETIDHDGDGGRYSEKAGAEYCWSCFESDVEHSSTITYLVNGDSPRTVKVATHWVLDGEYYEEIPAKESDKIHREWKASSAWRGHYNTTLDGWTEVREGVYLWGESTSIVELGTKLQDLHEAELLPCEVALIADPTSNLFAAGCSVWVRDEDLDAWNEQFSEEEES